MKFNTYSISELIDEIAMGPFGSNIKVECFVDDGIPVLNGSNLNGFFLTEDSFRYVTEEKTDSLGRANAHRGDIVITHRGTLGQIVCIPETSKYDRYVISQSQFRVKCNEKVLPEYLVYYFHTAIGQHKLLSNASQVGVPALARASTTFQKIEVEIPDIKTQQKVVSVLNAIEAKINVNRSINENLEQQVQTLFADWLSANNESATEIALGNICTKVTDGSHFSPKDDSTSSIPMLSVKDMREFDFDLTSCKHICEDDYEKMVANDCVPQVNDILVAKDGSYLKEIFICNEKRKLAILSSIAIFRPNTTVIHPEILLAFLKSPRVLQEVRDNYVSGSALPRIVLKDFKKLTFSLPDMDAQNLIAPLFASIREQIAVNVAENKYMTQLRDALLPKLMSGELNVDNIHL